MQEPPRGDRLSFPQRPAHVSGILERLPPAFLDTLNMVYDLRSAQKRKDRGRGVMLWDWSRGDGMEPGSRGDGSGRHQRPSCNAERIAAMSTTVVYADATGPEAQQTAERMR